MLKLATRGLAVMRARRRWHAVMALMAIALVACGDTSGPPKPGSIQVSTATAGFLKPGSYALVVNGAVKQTIGANDNVTLDAVDPGTHLVTLGEVPANCSVEGATVAVEPEATATVSLAVTCTFEQPTAYTIRFLNDRPNLETGEITACTFGLCPIGSVWDLYAYENTATEPRTEIRQNDKTAIQIAHVTGVTLSGLTEAHVAAASFTAGFINEPFSSDRVILIRKSSGSIYALGNPSEDLTTVPRRMTFHAALLNP
jgi:hypothetical protein